MTPRTMLIEALGGKCAKCGYSGHPKILQLCVPPALAELRNKMSREAYYFYLYAHQEPDRPVAQVRLLCLNCKFEEMYGAQETSRKSKVYIWRTGMSPDDLQDLRLDWLDSHLKEAERVYVVAASGCVYAYPDFATPIAKEWSELNLGPLPKETTGYVEIPNP